jgi:hypothetical protein
MSETHNKLSVDCCPVILLSCLPHMSTSFHDYADLFPELRACIRHFLDPVTRTRLRLSSRSTYNDDGDFRLPKLVRASMDEEEYKSPEFCEYIKQWLTLCNAPWFRRFESALSSVRHEVLNLGFEQRATIISLRSIDGRFRYTLFLLWNLRKVLDMYESTIEWYSGCEINVLAETATPHVCLDPDVMVGATLKDLSDILFPQVTNLLTLLKAPSVLPSPPPPPNKK